MHENIEFWERCGEMMAAEEKEKPKEKPVLQTISATDLQNTDFGTVHPVVEGLLTNGLNLIASPPKYGKSWMVLDLCLSVADNAPFLGRWVRSSRVLYLALEDSHSRLKARMERILGGRPAPEDFDFATTANTMDTGLIDELDGYMDIHPDTGLIVIDTLQKVRGAMKYREGTYGSDYREMGDLKRFADRHCTSVLVVHHLRKMQSEGDPFDRISGTNGIFGAVDTAIVLTRDKRTDETTRLSATGRDIEPLELVLQFNKQTSRWESLGSLDCFAEKQAIRNYHEDPVVLHVRELLRKYPEGWIGGGMAFLEGTDIDLSPKALNKRIQELKYKLLEIDGISYTPISSGSGGTRHRFTFINKEEEITENPFL